MRLWVYSILLAYLQPNVALQSGNCQFNSLCTCSVDNSRTGEVFDVSCVSAPFYKLPNVPEGTIGQLEIVGARMSSLEGEALAGRQVHALTLSNNKLQRVAERALSSMSKSLASLDLSYNELDAVPFPALRELRNLQWLNLHSNRIHTISGDWSHMKNTLANLFLGENDITEVPLDNDHVSKSHHSLRQFKSLIWLNLDDNRISRVHKHALPTSLQTISVSHNLIDYFPLELVSALPNLQWLYLRGNHIKYLPEHTFPRKLWLEKIDLSENSIKSLPKSPFNNSVYIRDLNLAFNDIKSLAADSFLGLKCGRIVVSNNALETIDRKGFSGLHDSLEYLDFDHNNLMHVPHALNQLRALKYLYLSSNQLAEIPERGFESFCSNLRALSLSGNRLTSIPRDALQNCSKIVHFNIGYNEIYEINQSDFSNWAENVKTLLLGNNRLTTLKSQSFTELFSLTELVLSFNPIRHVEANVFEGLDKLESLEISFGMDLEVFPADILHPLPNLQWLSLDNNNFNVIADNALSSLSQLRYLNLESNRIEEITPAFFDGTIHSHLKDIRFSNNQLSLIHSESFRSLPSLESILLSGNYLKALYKNTFQHLPNLTTIILSNNLIHQIDAQTFTNLPYLSKLDLHNNRLSGVSFKYFENISSAAPLSLNLSRNHIAVCDADYKIINLEALDLRFNNIGHIPRCLENVSQLKRLFLDYNIISSLEHNTFMHLTSLEELTLKRNSIHTVNKRAFFGLQKLQKLDLSKNYISQLHVNQFPSMTSLRILDLSGNNLNYLPKDIFAGTVLEMLDLSTNSFAVVPSLTLSEVGVTLRQFSIRSNIVEHVDSTTFPDIPYLKELDLSNNKLTILPDNVFTTLGALQKLDLSSNPIRANFKELFHYAQSLKELNLARTGIVSTPHLPLPNLVHLNLSLNRIEVISKASVQDLAKLKYLYLNHNQLSKIPSHLWNHLPLLKTLDFSYNPVKEIAEDHFSGLTNLQNLNIQGLKHLQKFDSAALTQVKLLSSLSIQTWPKIDHFRAQLCNVLANLHQLRVLKLHVEETFLRDQLACVSNKKIRRLVITGHKLKNIDRDAFARLARNPHLDLQITDTQIEELPDGLFANLNKISHLSIDLRRNLLSYLSPDVFYANVTTWKNVGTTMISGGLTLSENPWRCGCHLAWLGHWLRRWTYESLQSHNAPVETSARMNDIITQATCTDSTSGISVPIVQLLQEDMSCQASALSGAVSPARRMSVILVLSLSFSYYLAV